jgi:hypothetical protein
MAVLDTAIFVEDAEMPASSAGKMRNWEATGPIL